MKKLKLAAWLLLVPLFFIEGAFVLKERKINHLANLRYQKNSIGIYLVNLDRAQDRLQKVLPLIEVIGFPVIRISAVDGKELPKEYIDSVVDYKSYKNFIGHYSEPGTIGCYLSHLKTWEEFLKSNYEYALIFEDDVSFEAEHVERVVSELLKKPQLWDICSFELLHSGGPKKIAELIDNFDLVVYKHRVSHTGAYIINRKAALQLLKYSYPIKMPVDHFFTRNWELGLKFTGVEPRIVYQTFGDSYIKDGKTKNDYGFSVIIHRAIYEIKSAIMRFVYSFI
ncbi:MAG: glycosyltransferase family 25 protein [Candidatus Midichloria sp.]|uniref:Glycosyltransferase family 25 (LPS biosynthesis protein) n=1 Tax=Hyalomma marginatum TaxID=34627 RepID=A0A8S4BV30_9ACAR|nr:Glycosyltransferase family 25 (LPS biosynthesis protein) [Hyalomma marginatum]CAG7593085.1 Glycosyltransferase family 25 (LPS biosynthesis protein) [Hyalomma marginatum]